MHRPNVKKGLVRPVHKGIIKPGRRFKRRRKADTVWVRSLFLRAVRSRSLFVPANPDVKIVILNNSIKRHTYGTLKDLVVTAKGIVRGSSNKVAGVADTNDTAINPSGLDLTAAVYSGKAGATAAEPNVVCAWIATFSGSEQAYTKRPIIVDIGPIVGAAGPVQTIPTPVVTLLIYPNGRTPFQVLLFSCANAGGIGTLTPGSHDSTSGVAASLAFNGLSVRAIDANTYVDLESINERDFVGPLDPKNCSDEEESDEEEEDGWYDEAGGLVRDEDGNCFDGDGNVRDC